MKKKVTTGIMVILLSTGMLALAFDIQPLRTESRISETNHNSNVIATYGRGYLENVSGLLVLHVKGSPYEMGFQNGYLLKDRIKWLIQAYLYDIIIDQWGYSYEYLIFCSQALEPHIPQEYIEEMHGLADGAGMDYTDILLFHTCHDTNFYGKGWTGMASVPMTSCSNDTYMMCSDFAVFGDSTVDHHLYFGKSGDWMLPAEPVGLITIYDPLNGIAFVNVGFFGIIGVTAQGMNENGICASLKACSSGDKTLDGMPRLFMNRKALQYSTNLSEAFSMINQTERTCGASLSFGDGRNLNACAIETSDNHCRVFWAGDPAENISPHYGIENAVRRANHFVDPELAATQRSPYDPRDGRSWSWDRYEKLSQLITDNYGQIDAEMSIQFLQTSPISDWCACNLQSIVFDATDLELWVANANSTTPAYLREFIHLSRNDLFPILGDINHDGAVDIYDVVTVSLAFDSEPGDDNWNPIADVAEPYGEIDIFDVVTVTMNFGKTV